MCLIILNMPGNRTKDEYLIAADKVNSDGIGIAYAYENKLNIKKDFVSVDDFIEYYKQIPSDAVVMTHFRAASCGEKSIENRHPFIVNDNLAMVHNGHLYKFSTKTDKSKTTSDTVEFGNQIIKNIINDNPESYTKDWFKTLIEDFIGVSNKLVFLDNFGYFVIVNEVKGTWEEENQVWYSNLIFKDILKTNKNNNKPFNYLTKPQTDKKNVVLQLPYNQQKRDFYKYAPNGVSESQKAGGTFAVTVNGYRQCFALPSDPNRLLTFEEIANLCMSHKLKLKKLRKKNIVLSLRVNYNV